MNDCIIWGKGKSPKGYGVTTYQGKQISAHRAAWAKANGRLPLKGMVIAHNCDNPSCINPSHLKECTQKENLADMRKRGRDKPPKGEINGQSKLTQSDVQKIRELYKSGNYLLKELAKMFQISLSQASAIKTYRKWKK